MEILFYFYFVYFKLRKKERNLTFENLYATKEEKCQMIKFLKNLKLLVKKLRKEQIQQKILLKKQTLVGTNQKNKQKLEKLKDERWKIGVSSRPNAKLGYGRCNL